MKGLWYKAPLAVLLSASMILTSPGVGASAETSAELQTKLDAAKQQLEDLNDQAEQASEAVNETEAKLDDTKGKIEDTKGKIDAEQAELDKVQGTLSALVVNDYKGGSVNILDIVVNSSSVQDLVSNIFYANRVSENQRSSIQNAKAIQTELQNQKDQLDQQESEQSQLLESQKSQQADLEQKTRDAQGYVDSLSEEVQQALAAEQAAAQRQAEEEAAAAARAAANNGGSYVDDSAPNGSATDEGGTNTTTNTSTPGSNGSTPAPPSNSNSSGWRNTVVSAAYSMVGGTYVYGAYSPGSRTFDCSGLVAYCYAQAGYNLPHYSEAQHSYCTKPISQAQPGDIVWKPGHVGIYIGDGKTIEARDPQLGITFGTVGRFSACGSPAA